MDTVTPLLRRMRLSAGLSQRALAGRAGTSQPAVARYERGTTTPSWQTLQRLAAACGWRITAAAEPVPDEHDVGLAESMLSRPPVERLRALRRYAGLRASAQRGR